MSALAQNPIIKGIYSADPTARVFDGKLYVYPSHDIISPVEPERKWFCMADYHVYTTADMCKYQDLGVILDQKDVPWGNPESYSMWAPDCIEKDGKYYFFFPANVKDGRGFGVGVAVADKPEGPFVAREKNIEGISGIDPCVIKGYDGKYYIYWGGGGLMCAQIKDDFSALDESVPSQEVKFGDRTFTRVGVDVAASLPEGFKEGPFAFTRNGKYYLTYPWVRGKAGDPGPDGKPLDNHTETLAYAMSDSPYGPFEYKGLIMKESPTGCWTNHHSIVEYKGQWYLFYHHNDYSPDFDKLRSVRCDSLFFNPDGTIRPVIPTFRGVGITQARNRIQIDRYSSIAGGAKIDFLNAGNRFNGWKTIFPKEGSSVDYNRVDFTDLAVGEVVIRAKSPVASKVAVKANGRIVATVDIPQTAVWCDVRAEVKVSPRGINNISVTLIEGKNTEIDYIGFDMK